MKRENIISIITLLFSLLVLAVSLKIQNMFVKKLLCLTGLVLIILSIIFEKKAKNPKKQNFVILHSIIAKSRRNKKD